MCDAGVFLKRAAEAYGGQTDRTCPICRKEQLWQVSWVYGDDIGDYSGSARNEAQLEALARSYPDFAVHEVEVCRACGWNHLVRSYRTGTPGTAPARRSPAAGPARPGPVRTCATMEACLDCLGSAGSGCCCWGAPAPCSGSPLLVGVGYALTDVPEPNESATATATRILYSDRSEMGRVGSQNRIPVPLSKVPEDVQRAVLSAEDRGHYTSPGINPKGIARALFANVKGGGVEQGGSTITQQYAKNAFLTQDRTFSRKVKEVFIALKMTRTVDKDKILEDYLNTIYFGRQALRDRGGGADLLQPAGRQAVAGAGRGARREHQVAGRRWTRRSTRRRPSAAGATCSTGWSSRAG